ncbi:hypothetical protein [Vibrio parahaemolyticus]|uniref:hypothetical protein n=1 Tax=Vibrio parahaemolyticus TaxID=670 RepID=UPI001642A763|nr:hypothetical protein [Vibrio parahaemolyticus]
MGNTPFVFFIGLVELTIEGGTSEEVRETKQVPGYGYNVHLNFLLQENMHMVAHVFFYASFLKAFRCDTVGK